MKGKCINFCPFCLKNHDRSICESKKYCLICGEEKNHDEKNCSFINAEFC